MSISFYNDKTTIKPLFEGFYCTFGGVVLLTGHRRRCRCTRVIAHLRISFRGTDTRLVADRRIARSGCRRNGEGNREGAASSGDQGERGSSTLHFCACSVESASPTLGWQEVCGTKGRRDRIFHKDVCRGVRSRVRHGDRKEECATEVNGGGSRLREGDVGRGAHDRRRNRFARVIGHIGIRLERCSCNLVHDRGRGTGSSRGRCGEGNREGAASAGDQGERGSSALDRSRSGIEAASWTLRREAARAREGRWDQICEEN